MFIANCRVNFTISTGTPKKIASIVWDYTLRLDASKNPQVSWLNCQGFTERHLNSLHAGERQISEELQIICTVYNHEN